MNKTQLEIIMDTLFLFLCLTLSLPFVNPISSNNSTLVYKTCSDQTFFDSNTDQSHSQTLSSLFQALVSQSSKSKFFKTTELSSLEDQGTAISGLFQCREDLGNEECSNCVKALPEMTRTLCRGSLSGRVQLHGCYIRYEPDEVVSTKYYSENELVLLHKTCGGVLNQVDHGGFEAMRDAAFSALEDAIVAGAGAGGFCKMNYELVQVMAQCEGEIEACECGGCVSKAMEIAQEECSKAVSAEVYLEKCSLSYYYYPEGIPGNSNKRGDGENNGSNGRTLAIVLGGAAALFFGLIFMFFFKSWTKKDDDDFV